jgi:hypothetical protein
MRVSVVREEDDLGQFFFLLDYQKSDGQIISLFLDCQIRFAERSRLGTRSVFRSRDC